MSQTLSTAVGCLSSADALRKADAFGAPGSPITIVALQMVPPSTRHRTAEQLVGMHFEQEVGLTRINLIHLINVHQFADKEQRSREQCGRKAAAITAKSKIIRGLGRRRLGLAPRPQRPCQFFRPLRHSPRLPPQHDAAVNYCKLINLCFYYFSLNQ